MCIKRVLACSLVRVLVLSWSSVPGFSVLATLRLELVLDGKLSVSLWGLVGPEPSTFGLGAQSLVDTELPV